MVQIALFSTMILSIHEGTEFANFENIRESLLKSANTQERSHCKLALESMRDFVADHPFPWTTMQILLC